jgi:hypothetical protein
MDETWKLQAERARGRVDDMLKIAAAIAGSKVASPSQAHAARVARDTLLLVASPQSPSGSLRDLAMTRFESLIFTLI